jgi:ribonuclease E
MSGKEIRMTERSDLATEVQTQPEVDAGETVSEPAQQAGTQTASSPEQVTSGTSGSTEPAAATAESRGPSRRGRRGGRNRGGSRAKPATTRPETGSASVAAPDGSRDEPEIPDGDRVETDPAAEGEPRSVAAATASPGASRRRRRRGGRGRGARGRSGSSSRIEEDAEAVTGGADAGDDLDEPAEPEPRPEVALLEAIADEDVVEAAENAIDHTVGEALDVATERLDDGDAAAAPGTTARRRRRRGGRGRGRGRAATETLDGLAGEAAIAATDAADAAASATQTQEVLEDTADADTAPGRTKGAAKTRQATRTRSRPSKTKTLEEDEAGETSAVATSGPTRLRRGRGTSAGARRRREPTIIAPRVTDKVMVITQHGDRDQIAILEERTLVQHYVTRAGAKSMVGNVYLGRVQNVLPGMEAAFVDVGRGRNAVLYAGEVNYSPEDLEGKQPPRIEQVLKSGQSVLVQVTKDPIGGKGARLTAKISMPGRYLVLQPNWEITGISKRLDDGERRRLRALLKRIRPEGHGLIVRTAAEGASEEDLRADVDRLLSEWAAIEKKAKRAKAPAVLYEEPELTVKVVRDLFTNEEYRELVTDSQRVYTLVTDYLGGVAPDLLPKVRLHTGKLPVFEEFHVVEQIHKGLDRKVWLPSGGYLVIDRTEAMTVIDVNTGKSVGKTNLEETVVNTNIEAAREVARQLRLRDIGGMIIIDFIDMLLEQNKRRVVDTLKEEMARDKTRSQVFDISPLGLLEVTRKRVSGGLLESFSETCPTCEGRGVILNYEP